MLQKVNKKIFKAKYPAGTLTNSERAGGGSG
jgi:hypothetical protein